MPPIALGTLLVLLFAYLACALGVRLQHLARLEFVNPGERLLVAAGLGLGALQAVSFLLFALGIGRPPAFHLVLGLLSIALIPDGIRVSVLVRAWAHTLRPIEIWQWALYAIFGILLGALYLRALCPLTSHDDLSYHLAASVRFLDAGGFRYLPTLTYTNWPTAVELLFATGLAIHREAPVAVVQFLFGLITLGGVYAVARRVGGFRAGSAACVLLLIYPVFWEEMTLGHVDLGTTAFSILAVFSLIIATGTPESSRRWRTLAAIFGGLAATTKLSGIWVLVTICILGAGTVASEKADHPTRPSLEFLRCLLIGTLVVAPWFIRTWVVTGNPVYPALYGLFGGIEWTAEGWPRVQRYFMLFNSPPGLPATPQNLAFVRMAIVCAAFALFALVYRVTRGSPLALPARFAALFVSLFVLSSAFQLRLVLAAIPAVAACAGAALSKSRVASVPVLATLAILLGIYVAKSRFFEGQGFAVKVAIGLDSREAYLNRYVPDYPVVQYVNAALPPDARILVSTWEEQTALYRPLALRANYWLQDSIHYDSEPRLMEDLRRLRITHLIHQPLEDAWCGNSKICRGRRDNESRTLGRFALARGTPMGEWNGVTLYRLNLADSRPPNPKHEAIRARPGLQ